MKNQCSTEVSGSQGNCEFLEKSQRSAQILEDPSWFSLNRWWFVTHSFPWGITQEAIQSSREQVPEKQGREDRSKVLGFENAQALLGELETQGLNLSLATDYLVVTTAVSFFKREHPISKGKVKIQLNTIHRKQNQITTRFELSFSSWKGHWWTRLNLLSSQEQAKPRTAKAWAHLVFRSESLPYLGRGQRLPSLSHTIQLCLWMDRVVGPQTSISRWDCHSCAGSLQLRVF